MRKPGNGRQGPPTQAADATGTPSDKALRHPLSRRRKWLFRCIAVTLVPALFFLALEAGLRVFGYGSPTRFFLKVEGRDAYAANQRFGWQFFPPAIARAPVVLEIPARKAEDTCRIFVLGSSAAMGTPEPAFGFSRMLEAMLSARYPGVKFEVVNAAMTAINSHVVLPIARECCGHQPDLLVVYMGNNEVIGPYGPGTAFAAFSPSLSSIRAGIFLKSTRTGQFLHDLLQRGTARGQVLAEWKGMEMFHDEKARVALDDPRLPRAREHFRANLSGICKAAHAAGAKILLSTVAVNLKDCAPLASLHRSDLAEDEHEPWEKHYQAGMALAAQGKHGEAVAEWRRAAAIDDRFADLHFRLARSLLTLGQADKAREHFPRARDLDALRFRADAQTNEVIRDVASQWADRGACLVDAEQAFAEHQRTQHGVPGREWFYEHVHFNPEGNHLLASTVFRQLAAALPEWVQSRAAEDLSPLSLDECCERTVLTGWDRYQMESDMAGMTERPPFTGQLDYSEQRAWRRNEVSRLRGLYATPAALEDADRRYVAAIRQAPQDLDFRQNLARLLYARGQFDRAIELWRALLDQFPRLAKWRFELGAVYEAAGKNAEAITEYEEAARLNPTLASLVCMAIGNIRLHEKRPEEAEQEFRRSLELDPLRAKACNGLGTALGLQGRSEEAVEYFRRAVELDPGLASAHINLGAMLGSRGDLAAAIKEYRLASEAEPLNLETYHRLFSVLMKQGKTGEAIAEYRRMVREMPDSAEAHFRLGSLLQRTGEFGDAIVEFRTALRLDPAHLKAGHSMGEILEATGQTSAAVQQYRRVLEQHPDSAPTREKLQRLLGRL